MTKEQKTVIGGKEGRVGNGDGVDLLRFEKQNATSARLSRQTTYR